MPNTPKTNAVAMRRLRREKAMESDETLGMTHEMRHHVECLKQQSEMLAEKMRSKKSKLETEHASAIKSRDSALAASEEYKKGYYSVRKAFMQAKEDLAETMSAFRNSTRKQRERSKYVLERLAKGTESTMAILAFQCWSRFTKDNFVARQNERLLQESLLEMAAVQDNLRELQQRRLQEAYSAVEHAALAMDEGLVALTFQRWFKHWDDDRRLREEALKVRDLMRCRKVDAQKSTERELGRACAGVMAVALRDWMAAIREEKAVRCLQAEANEAAQSHRQQRRGDGLLILDRLSKEKQASLLSQVFLIWLMQRELDRWEADLLQQREGWEADLLQQRQRWEADLLQQREGLEADLSREREVVRGLVVQQMEKSKPVIDRLIKGQEFSVLAMVLRNWVAVTDGAAAARRHQKESDAKEEVLLQLQRQTKDNLNTRKDKASRVLDRLAEAADMALLSAALKGWKLRSDEEMEAKSMANHSQRMTERLRAKMRAQAADARRLLERNLEVALYGITSAAFDEWHAQQLAWKMERYVRDKEEQAEAYKLNKKEEASKVLERVSAASDFGLTHMVLLTWRRHFEEEETLRAQAEEVRGTIQQQRAEAQRLLQRSLGATADGVVAIALRDWAAHVREEQSLKSLQEKADCALADYKDRKRVETNAVLERLSTQQTPVLLQNVLLFWSMDKELTKALAAHRDEKQVLQGLIERQMQKSKSVLAHLFRKQASTATTTAFKSWCGVLAEARRTREGDLAKQEASKRLDVAHSELKAYKAWKRAEAVRVLDRMAGACDSRVLAIALQTWQANRKDAVVSREEAQKVRNGFRNQKEEARRLLLKNLLRATGGLQASTFHSWKGGFRERRTAQTLKASAEKQLSQYKRRKKKQSTGVLHRVCEQRRTSLMLQGLMAWRLHKDVCIANAIISRQKNRSRGIVDRLAWKFSNTKVSLAWHSWTSVTSENKTARQKEQAAMETRAEVTAVQEEMLAYKARKCCEAARVLTSLSAASDTGLLSLVLQAWTACCNESRCERGAVARLREHLGSQKMEAQRLVERSLVQAVGGTRASTFSDWSGHVREQRAVRELKAKAEERLRSYKDRKRSESAGIVDRMCSNTSAALLQQVLHIWVLWQEVEKTMRTYLDEKEVYTGFISRQKEKSKSILCRFIANQDSSLASLVMQSWVAVTMENRVARANNVAAQETEQELNLIRERMTELQQRKKDEARGVLDRLASTTDSGFASLLLQNWAAYTATVRSERDQATHLKKLIQGHREEARRSLEKHLGTELLGILASAFHDWTISLAEERNVQELRAEADRLMKEYKGKRRSESLVILDRVSEQKINNLVQQVFWAWNLSIAEMIRANALQKELKNIMTLQKTMEAKMLDMS